MLFNSFQFAVFFPVVFALYFLLPHRFRWMLLLVASYAFYMAWEPAYALLILSSTVVDYLVALNLPDAPARRKRALLAISLTLNFGLLFSFKYYNLINGTFTGLAASAGIDWPLPESNMLLPVGISFYTFQTVGYTVDVYRGKIPPERHFGIFALYVSYFPQLVAGPIERAGRLLPQLRRQVEFDWDRVVGGFRQAAWGMFKKVVVADRLAELCGPIYDDPQSWAGPGFLIAIVCFTWQVYCDFSGYSDIAIGIARMMGVDLMKNFDQPHGSRSFQEIWNRWHISLSTWFRDYVYIPLGGSKHGQARWAFAVMVVFVTSGLWHGATWGYAIWGAMNGLFLVVERFTEKQRAAAAQATGLTRYPRLQAAIQIARTFALWQLTLVFFRAPTLTDAWYMLTHLDQGWEHITGPTAFWHIFNRLHTDWFLFTYSLMLIPLTELIDWARRQERWRNWYTSARVPVRFALDYALIFGVLFLGNFNDTAFVYFQF